MQSRRHSLLEACTNVAAGILVAWAVTFAVFPWFGYEARWDKSLGISLIFTVVSLVRSYLLRRLFNRFEATVFRRH
jgi:hypothetical protein